MYQETFDRRFVHPQHVFDSSALSNITDLRFLTALYAQFGRWVQLSRRVRDEVCDALCQNTKSHWSRELVDMEMSESAVKRLEIAEAASLGVRKWTEKHMEFCFEDSIAHLFQCLHPPSEHNFAKAVEWTLTLPDDCFNGPSLTSHFNERMKLAEVMATNRALVVFEQNSPIIVDRVNECMRERPNIKVDVVEEGTAVLTRMCDEHSLDIDDACLWAVTDGAVQLDMTLPDNRSSAVVFHQEVCRSKCFGAWGERIRRQVESGELTWRIEHSRSAPNRQLASSIALAEDFGR